MYLRVCSLSFVSVVVCVSSPFSCMRVLVFHLGGVCVLLHWRRLWQFGDRGSNLFGNCHLAVWHFTVGYIAVGYISVVWCGSLCVTCIHWLTCRIYAGSSSSFGVFVWGGVTECVHCVWVVGLRRGGDSVVWPLCGWRGWGLRLVGCEQGLKDLVGGYSMFVTDTYT